VPGGDGSKEYALTGENMPAKLTPEDFQQRFDAAALEAQREYCDIFEFWRLCRLKACRRAKACGGDAQLCLRRGFAQVPDETSEHALMRVIAATAADADRPTRLARQMSPQSFAQWPLRGLV
jgi:hypothetical protein